METLPNSKLVNTLIDKSQQTKVNDFDFVEELKRLKKVVCQELSYINTLFKEYTPHDKNYHIKNLFKIADALLDDRVLNQLNIVELFILAASLYAHDWGMAVSESEREYIKSLKYDEAEYVLIPNEAEIFIEHTKNLDDKVNISIVTWQDYIRFTHAERSGERVYKFFEKENSGIAESVKKACIGHYIDFSNLRNYSTNQSVLGEIVNLRAITTYVRLIDLLDLTEDRTPYIIWKFVSPRNEFSKMEWSKHRALHSITFPPYQDGRIIKVDGSTDNHEVYASLKDLQDWCEEQLRGCNDILAELYDERHRLNIYHSEWKIEAKGFKPTSIQFSFNRDRMFQILGKEIYGNDKYVFLRELLQNSIDAIKMRELIYNTEKMSFVGEIKVKLEHKQNGEMHVIWQDNGVGMNEYIIKNYLSVAGKSYYNSDDFNNEGINMDPISKFGIGLLSCDSVSDHLEIETFRDPFIEQNSKKLKITIPTFNRYLRIEECNNKEIRIGTKITIYISKKKVSDEQLNITEYLKNLVGFVKYPIYIEENNVTTILLNQESSKAELDLNDNTIVYNNNFEFPWYSFFVPQDVEIAKKYFVEKRISIKKDLNLVNYEGFVIVIIPKNDTLFDKIYQSPSSQLTIIDEKGVRAEIRLNENSFYYFENTKNEISPSCKILPSFSVYRDGILIPDVDIPYGFENRYYYSKPYRLIVNIPRNNEDEISISRTSMKSPQNWAKPIREAYCDYILKDYGLYQKEIKDIETLKIAASVTEIYMIQNIELLRKVKENNFILLMIDTYGKLVFEYYDSDSCNEYWILPEVISKNFIIEICNSLNNRLNDNVIQLWESEYNMLISSSPRYYYSSNLSNSTCKLFELTDKFIKNKFVLSELFFLESPDIKSQHLVLSKVKKRKLFIKDNDNYELIAKESYEPEELEYISKKWVDFLRQIKYQRLHYDFKPIFVYFNQAYSRYIGFEFEYINVAHPLGIKILHLIITIINLKITDDILGNILDSLNELKYNLDVGWKKLWRIVEENNIAKYPNESLITSKDFVPRSFSRSDINVSILKSNKLGNLL